MSRRAVQARTTPILKLRPEREERPVVQPLRYAVGIDGVRRMMPTPAPMATASAMSMPSAAPAISAPATSAAEAVTSIRPWQRPAIGFGLVASALLFAGAATWHYLPAVHGQALASNASKPAQVVLAAATTPAPQKAGLQQLLTDFVNANGASNFGLYVKDLKTGQVATVGADRVMNSASLYKLFVAQQTYRAIDHGNQSYGADAGGGTGRNIQDCLTIMINISDNGCGVALGNLLGWGAQNAALKTDGYTGTSLADPQQTNAQDVAKLLERLYTNSLNSPNSNTNFLNLLKDQRVNDRLPTGLPAGTVIAHKTGNLDDAVHDAGIVYGPKTDYLVVAMSNGWDAPGLTPAKFTDLSQRLWNFFEN